MFTKFQSLINESFRNVGEYLTNAEFCKKPAIVTEKLHGANFSLYLTKEGIKCFASRSQTLPLETNFMNCKRFFTEERISMINERCSLYVMEGTEVRIIGEIFGGLDIAGIKPIQKEVHYDGDISFEVFHVQIKKQSGEWVDLHWGGVESYSTLFNLNVVPVIAIGIPFSEAYELNTKVKSALSDKKQVCEGFCIRIDSEEFGEPPLIFKKRNEEFMEAKSAVKVGKLAPEQSDLAVAALRAISAYATPQRVSNVNSHFGFDSMKNFSDLLKEVVEDAIKDFNQDTGNDIKNEPVWVEIKKQFCKIFVPLVKQELMK